MTFGNEASCEEPFLSARTIPYMIHYISTTDFFLRVPNTKPHDRLGFIEFLSVVKCKLLVFIF